MEDLTKQQIVLVTILVSFVTSIATGIITVSMMNQAPQTFTQTVNRVVERTIERVVPDASIVKAVEPKVITLDDQVAMTSEIGLDSVVKVINQDNTVVAVGPLITKDGKVIAYVPPGKFQLQYSNGKKVAAKIESSNEEFSILKPTEEVSFTPLTFAKEVRSGKTVVLVAGDNIFQGIIQNASTTTTNIDSTKQVDGSFFLDLTGSLIGVNINNTFVPVAKITPYI